MQHKPTLTLTKGGNRMIEKIMKPYKGYTIIKSYNLKANNTIDSKSIVYTAYDEDNNLYDGKSKLTELKKEIDKYI